ncbi:MAG TPA: hypothetical protein VLD39_00350, partial [Gammaproteobacteria bacterium]|nr:hypothetical protein [Gammaproteobacteria bacterium]
MAHDEAALERLRTSRGFVFDLDGTLVLGDRRNQGLKPLPGAIELIGHLGKRGVPFVCMTNGTVRTPEQYVVKLAGLGFAVRGWSRSPKSLVGIACFHGRQGLAPFLDGVD